METFFNFYFWWTAFWMVMQALVICARKYPYIKEKSVGEDMFGFILMAFFFLWMLFIRLGVIQ